MVDNVSVDQTLLVGTVSTVLLQPSFSARLDADRVTVTPEAQSQLFVMRLQGSVSVSREPQVASVLTVCQAFGAFLIVEHASVMGTVTTATHRQESARDAEISQRDTTVNGV